MSFHESVLLGLKKNLIIRIFIQQKPELYQVQLLSSLPDLSRFLLMSYTLDNGVQSAEISKYHNDTERRDIVLSSYDKIFHTHGLGLADFSPIIALTHSPKGYRLHYEAKHPLFLEILSRVQAVLMFEQTHAMSRENSELLKVACKRLYALIRQNRNIDHVFN